MESQDPLIHSTTTANEDNSPNDADVAVVPPAKSRFLILEPAVFMLFLAWSLTGKGRFSIIFLTQKL